MAKNISIIGAGAWGTALAIRIAANGHKVRVWTRSKALAGEINSMRENSVYLPGCHIEGDVSAYSDMAEIINSEVIFLAAPSQHLRGVCQELKKHDIAGKPLVICSKGIEENTLLLMSDVVAGIFPGNKMAILSGPNFASEIARGLPAAAVVAAKDKNTAEKIADILASSIFRIYCSGDIVGVEIGGAAKNVLAIACGIATGKGYGENARAALITRGIAEIARLSKTLGGQTETLMGLSGIGDIMLTCASLKSRNMSLGFELGKGRSLKEILVERGAKVTEGVASSHSITMLAKKLKIEMPIAEAVSSILHENADIEKTIGALLSRKAGGEF